MGMYVIEYYYDDGLNPPLWLMCESGAERDPAWNGLARLESYQRDHPGSTYRLRYERA